MVESIVGKKLNKGEWAEFYVMLKLLGEGKLYTADKTLKKKLDSYLDILKIIRQEYDTQVLEYIVNENSECVTVKPQNTDTVLASIPMCEFIKQANDLFNGIKSAKGMSVPAPNSVCEFAKVIYVGKPKAPAVKALKKQFGGKNDIFIEVRDGQTSIVSVMGFSIKSKFGQNPTLFNAGSSSQFLYKISGCDDAIMQEFNAISDGDGRGWRLCKKYISDHNLTLSYCKTQNPIYDENLCLVRESMSKIMAWCVKDRLIDSTDDNKVKETVERMIATNPLSMSNPAVYYEKAVKDFLMAGYDCGLQMGRQRTSKRRLYCSYG